MIAGNHDGGWKRAGGSGPGRPDLPHGCSIESTNFHGLNVVTCDVITSGKWNILIGAYLPSSTLEHLPDLEEALARFRDQGPIVLGDLKADISQYQNPYIQEVADLLMEFGMLDLHHHFR